MPKRATLNPELFDIRAPDFFRHSSFAIRHSAAYAKRKAHRASRSRLRINSSDGLPYWALITMPNAKANGAMKPEANTVRPAMATNPCPNRFRAMSIHAYQWPLCSIRRTHPAFITRCGLAMTRSAVDRELQRSIVNPGKCYDFMLQRKTH